MWDINTNETTSNSFKDDFVCGLISNVGKKFASFGFIHVNVLYSPTKTPVVLWETNKINFCMVSGYPRLPLSIQNSFLARFKHKSI